MSLSLLYLILPVFFFSLCCHLGGNPPVCTGPVRMPHPPALGGPEARAERKQPHHPRIIPTRWDGQRWGRGGAAQWCLRAELRPWPRSPCAQVLPEKAAGTIGYPWVLSRLIPSLPRMKISENSEIKLLAINSISNVVVN